MSSKVYNVLFLCTGNSARSIIAEVVLNKIGNGRFHAFSAGSHPRGEVHPMAIKVLGAQGYDTSAVRSKSWEAFAAPGAPVMDMVFTVCDKAAGEVCPVWPGQPVTAHWSFPDPAAVDGNEYAQHQAFLATVVEMSHRLHQLVSLPLETIDRLSLQNTLRAMNAQSIP